MMETSKHTKGPWHVAFEEGTKIKDAGKNTVAWLQQTHLRGKRSEEEVAANARLIAAAPAMLEALRQMAVNSESDGHSYRDCHRSALEAIAKAEGRS